MRGATQNGANHVDQITFQSTHPLRGATCSVRSWPRAALFQSTHPLRGATRLSWAMMPPSLFQSTHPLRGATRVSDYAASHDGISIHAPLAGCDHPQRSRRGCDKYFNPRTPCGVRRDRLHILAPTMTISIHAPLAGCDPMHGRVATAKICISIHAPLAGCDASGTCDRARQEYFNPRTPCGVRPRMFSTHVLIAAFQSTHPLRGATEPRRLMPICYKISIHAPLAGCD